MEKIKTMFHHKDKHPTTNPTTTTTSTSTARPLNSTTTTTTTEKMITNDIKALGRDVIPPGTSNTPMGMNSGGSNLAPTTYSSAYSGGQGLPSSSMMGGQAGPGQWHHSQQQLQSGMMGNQQYEPSSMTLNQPDTVNWIEKAPVIHEQVRQVEKEVVQPVITREREQLEVHQITQPLTQQVVRPMLVEERVLQPEIRPVFTEQPRNIIPQVQMQSSTYVAPTMRQVVQNETLVEETVHRTIREEIQPVLYKETVIPRMIHEVKPIYERIVEAPQIFREERAPIQLREGETFGSLFGQQPRMMAVNSGQGGMTGQPPMSSYVPFSSEMKVPLSSTTTTTTTTMNPANKTL